MRLDGVGDRDPELAAVPQQPLEPADVVGRRDQQHVADAGEHQRRQRIVDHRLVVDRQELLAHRAGDGVEPRAGAAGQDDALAKHGYPPPLAVQTRAGGRAGGPERASTPEASGPCRSLAHPPGCGDRRIVPPAGTAHNAIRPSAGGGSPRSGPGTAAADPASAATSPPVPAIFRGGLRWTPPGFRPDNGWLGRDPRGMGHSAVASARRRDTGPRPVPQPSHPSTTPMKSFLNACGFREPLRLIVEGPQRPARGPRTLPQPFAVLGRDPRADMILDDLKVSRRHVYIQAVAGQVFWVDLESRTGTCDETGTRKWGWLGDAGPAPDRPVRDPTGRRRRPGRRLRPARGGPGIAPGRARLRPRAAARGRPGIPQRPVAGDGLADEPGDVPDRVGQGVQVPADRPERLGVPCQPAPHPDGAVGRRPAGGPQHQHQRRPGALRPPGRRRRAGDRALSHEGPLPRVPGRGPRPGPRLVRRDARAAAARRPRPPAGRRRAARVAGLRRAADADAPDAVPGRRLGRRRRARRLRRRRRPAGSTPRSAIRCSCRWSTSSA